MATALKDFPAADAPTSRAREFLLLAALAFLCFLNAGSLTGSVGLLIDPMRHSLGWTTAQVSQLPAVSFLAGAFAALAVGGLLDRWGGRMVMASSILISAIGFLLAIASENRSVLLAAFALAGIGSTGYMMVPCAYVVTRHVRLGLGVAMGVMLCGASLGSALIPMAIERIILDHGWHAALVTLAASAILIALPVVLVMVPPRVPGFEGDAVVDSEAHIIIPADDPIPPRLPVVSLLLTMTVQFLMIGSVMGLIIHFVPLMTTRGFTPATAIMLMGLANILGPVGLLAMGWLADRVGVFTVLLTAAPLNALAVALLLLVGQHQSSYLPMGVFILIWGLIAGCSSQLIPVVVTRFAPLAISGLCLGISGFMDGIASSAGPYATGIFSDGPGGYETTVTALAAAPLLATIPLILLRLWLRGVPAPLEVIAKEP